MSTLVAQWPPPTIPPLLKSLQELRDSTLDSEISHEIRGWLARLLVVRSIGYIEQGTVECCREHVRQKSGGYVKSFAVSHLERSRNPNVPNLLDLLGRFDAALSEDFSDFVQEDDEKLQRELMFFLDRRNKIAHGMNEGINPTRAASAVEVAERIVDWFVLRLNPHRY